MMNAAYRSEVREQLGIFDILKTAVAKVSN
jgi:hypothetical protein